MPLTKEQIATLMALPRRRGGGGKRKSGPDTSIRDHQTWFKLGAKMVDEDTGELRRCDNEFCIDPRAEPGKNGLVVVEINGKYMCRHCFLDGWLLEDESQTQLSNTG